MNRLGLLVLGLALVGAGPGLAKVPAKKATPAGWAIHKTKDSLSDETKCSIDSPASHGVHAGATERGLIFALGQNAALAEYRFDDGPVQVVGLTGLNSFELQLMERGLITLPWSDVGDARRVRIRAAGAETTFDYPLAGVRDLVSKAKAMGCP